MALESAQEIKCGRNILVYGVIRELGAAIFQKFPTEEDVIFGVSRSVPTFTNVAKSSYWIQADLGNSEESAHKVTETLGAIPLDILIYNVGVWEEKAFSEAYDFESVPASEITKMVTTNFTSAILNIQSVITELAIIEECEDYSDRFHLGAESSGQRVGIFGNEIWLKRNCGIVAGNRARRSDWRFSFEFGLFSYRVYD